MTAYEAKERAKGAAVVAEVEAKLRRAAARKRGQKVEGVYLYPVGEDGDGNRQPLEENAALTLVGYEVYTRVEPGTAPSDFDTLDEVTYTGPDAEARARADAEARAEVFGVEVTEY